MLQVSILISGIDTEILYSLNIDEMNALSLVSKGIYNCVRDNIVYMQLKTFSYGRNDSDYYSRSYNFDNHKSKPKNQVSVCKSLPFSHFISTEFFLYCCKIRDFDKCKEIFDLNRKNAGVAVLNIHANNEEAFRISIATKNSALTKWLINKSLEKGETPVNIHADNEYAFRTICTYDLALWQYIVDLSLNSALPFGAIDIHANSEECFRLMAKQGNLKMCKSLYKISLNGGSWSN